MRKMEHLIDLGWQNYWTETPEIVKKCKRKGHKPTDRDVGPPFRGLEHIVQCNLCKYIYRYDSSD